ncbi:MAG: DinB family protein [Candidatus Eiseniibacteriota bacterium]
MSPAKRGGAGGRKKTGGSAAKKSPPRAPKQKARSPRLEIVRRAKPKSRAVPPEAFPQASGASGKQQVLFEMVRARAALLAAIQGLTGASAEQPLEEGEWTVRETVLHLCAWDDMSLRALETALHGIPPEWAEMKSAELEQLNAEGVNALRHHGWDESLRLLQWSRQRLMESAEGVAAEPGQVWGATHPFGALLLDLASNDRHHAEAIKCWRTGREQ